MAISKTMLLFGNAQSKVLAQIKIENHPAVQRLDLIASGKIRLIMYKEIKGSDWVSELQSCGIQGFCML